MRVRHFILLALSAGLFASASAAFAFTMADGKSVSCIAKGVAVREYESSGGDPVMRDRVGMTVPESNGYVIAWNAAKLSALPPVVHDFIFFHECAHARIPTTDEPAANCGGLKDMREAGRANVEVESKLAAYFASLGSTTYWDNTVRCANRPLAPASPLPGSATKPPG